MNRERIKSLLPIIIAYAEGKAIQCKYLDSSEWTNISYLDFTSSEIEYRIKPDLYVRWLNFYPTQSTTEYPTKEAADSAASPNRIACIQVEFFRGEGL